MPRLDTAIYELGKLDLLAEKNTLVHRLDPRAKLLSTLYFIVCVVSFNKYEISGLLPFFIFPAILIGLADLPFTYLLRKLVIVSPFVLLIGIFNPFLDREVLMQIGSVQVSGGMVSFLSIILRFILTIGACLILIATTGFTAICMSIERLGAPRIFAVLLLMLYRYIFVLIEESVRMIRAYSLRSFSQRKIRFTIFRQLLGNLLLRTIDRAQRIHTAMLSRAFTGDIRISRQFSFQKAEYFYLTGIIILLSFFRFFNISEILGKLITGGNI
jgi:cobalt/nickel transport system permease protein